MSISGAKCLIDVLRSDAFQVPDFQRDYSWRQEHWEEFWADVRKAKQNERLFLGAVILLKEPSADSGTSEEFIDTGQPEEVSSSTWSVVDGQQRIATLSIFLVALRNVIRHAIHDAKRRAVLPVFADATAILDDTVKEKLQRRQFRDVNEVLEHPCGGGTPKPRLRLNKKDEVVFEEKVFRSKEANFEAPLAQNAQLVVKCFDFFLKKIVDVANVSDGMKALHELINQVNAIDVIKVVVDEDDEAYEVFESLNAKGEQLSAADLLKNRVLTECLTKFDREEAVRKWDELASMIEHSRFDLVDFIFFYWGAFYDDKPSTKGLYKAVKRKMQEGLTPLELLNGLKESAEPFTDWTRKTRVFPTSNREDDPWAECNSMAYRALYPSMLRIQRQSTTVTDWAARASCNFLVRTISIGGQSVKRAESAFQAIRRKVREDDPIDDVALKTEIRKIFSEWGVDDELFSDKLRGTIKDNKKARYVLSKMHYCSAAKDHCLSEDVHLEHVLPQSPKDHWSGFMVHVPGADGDVDEVDGFGGTHRQWLEQIEPWIYQLGNMALLDKANNSYVGNKPMSKKIEVLDAYHADTRPQGTSIQLTTDIVESYQNEPESEQWVRAKIKKRTQSLVEKYALKIWPNEHDD